MAQRKKRRRLKPKELHEAMEILYGQYWWTYGIGGERYPSDDASQREVKGWLQKHDGPRVLKLMWDKQYKLYEAGFAAQAPERRKSAKPALDDAERARRQRLADMDRWRKEREGIEREPVAPREPKLKPEAAKRAALGLANKKSRFAF
jgi:hypothetical protein